VTRADLRLITGLSRSAIAEGVQDLIDDRLIAESVLPPGGKGAGRGRPSALLVPTTSAGVVAAIDFGHAHVAAAIAATDGRALAEQRMAVEVDNQREASLDTASGLVTRLLGQSGRSMDDLRTVAVGIPAPIDVHTGRLRPHTVLERWHEADPAAALASRLGRRVVVANDAEMGAQGELRFGAARGLRDFVYVKVSEGVGASMVLNGSVYSGAGGLSGEIGHIRLSEHGGTWCRCGNRGCLETVLSTNVIEQRFREAVGRSADPVFPLLHFVSDPVISAFVLEAGRTLGRVLADLCNWLNPQGIIIGGVLGTAGELAVDGVSESIGRYASPMTRDGLEIRPAELGLRSELMGAVAAACRDSLYMTEADAS
jgi:predicted NBD/HSP70 family sugar kinase